MIIRNTKYHFGLISILLHWIMAILLIGLLVLGIYMVNLPISLQKLKMYGWHKEYGLLALALVIVRILWRWMKKSRPDQCIIPSMS
jgi:cytochrome b561